MLYAVIDTNILLAPLNISLSDIKDLPFYIVAKQTQDKKSFLVTGNLKHFPIEPFIVTPRQLVNRIAR